VPSQQQLRWSQLRVGLTVLFASIVLATLIFLMSGEIGFWTKKIDAVAYFDNAGGLRVGAPVRLQGVDVGNVTSIRVVPGRKLDPVEVTMKLSTKYHEALRKDSLVSLATAGVLGETFVDIDSRSATGAMLEDGDVLPARDKPDIQDVVRSTQSTLENMQILLKRLDNIVATIEKGEGSIGKFINDPSLFNRMDATLRDMNNIVRDVRAGKGTIGKFLNDEELYNRANSTVAKVEAIVDRLERGEGTAGKFLKDPALYDDARQTVAKANRMMDDINSGKGALGKMVSDQEFAKKLENTMNRVSSIATRLDQGEGTAGRLLVDPSLYQNADQMLVETRNLVKAIRENPKKYLTIHFRLF
jgi:phospholipid/cholesterol/gamma-HCH transport system substrate-binding protein